MDDKPTVFYIGPNIAEDDLLGALAEKWNSRDFRLDSWKHAKVGSITFDLLRSIDTAFCVLADTREPNPNVYYEIGLAHAFDTPVIPFKLRDKELPFDIRDQEAVPVEMEDGEIVQEEGMIRALNQRLKLLSESPSSAFRSAVTSYRIQAEPQQRDEENSRQRSPDGWLYMAQRGLLEPLDPDHLRPEIIDHAVYHTRYGLGVIVGFNPPQRFTTTVTIEFDGGAYPVAIPNNELFFVPGVVF